MNLPDSSGFATFEQVFSHAGTVPIVILTGLQDEELAVRAVAAGAQDYLMKEDIDAGRLVRSLRFAIHRKRGPSIRVDPAHYADVKERLQRLTSRERQVLDLIVQGYAVKQIAGKLGTHPNTVRSQRAALLHKMKGTCDADLVRMALLVDLPWK